MTEMEKREKLSHDMAAAYQAAENAIRHGAEEVQYDLMKTAFCFMSMKVLVDEGLRELAKDMSQEYVDGLLAVFRDLNEGASALRKSKSAVKH